MSDAPTYHIVSQLTLKDLDPDEVKCFGYKGVEPRRRNKIIPAQEIQMDNLWPPGSNPLQIKAIVDMNKGGQLYAQTGGGTRPGSGFWVPVVIELGVDQETLTSEVSAAIDLVSLVGSEVEINQNADDFFAIPSDPVGQE